MQVTARSTLLLHVGLVAASAWAPAAQAQVQQVEWTSPTPSLVEEFGTSLASSGGRVLVGAPGAVVSGFGTGAAYVFEQGHGGWTSTAELSPSDLPIGAEFGAAVAIDGTRAVVGAFRDGLPNDHGSVYVFDETPGGWVESAKLVAVPASGPLEFFGASVAVEGDRLVAGAPARGMAYVFERIGGRWEQTAELSEGSLGMFGFSVALQGDRIAVGSLEDYTVGPLVGAVFVYALSGSTWVLEQTLAPPPEFGPSHFGRSVVFDGDRLLVGNPAFSGFGPEPASVRVFERSGTTWSETANLTPDENAPEHFFGTSLAVAGDRVLVGASSAPGPGGSSGAAFVFEHDGTTWTQAARLDAHDGVPMQNFGRSVAATGDLLFVGAPRDSDATTFAGSVYAFEASPDVSSFCHCDQAVPCANGDAFGGCASERGVGAVLSAWGGTSVSTDDLRFEIAFVPAGNPGLLFMGSGAMVALPFGNGQRCVGGDTVIRFPPVFTDGVGSAEYGPGLAAFSAANFPAAAVITPGSEWLFQFWFRDPGGPCGSSFNLSNGVAVGYGP